MDIDKKIDAINKSFCKIRYTPMLIIAAKGHQGNIHLSINLPVLRSNFSKSIFMLAFNGNEIGSFNLYLVLNIPIGILF